MFYCTISQIVLIHAQSFNIPVWMEKGKYVQYEFDSAGIIFLNNTLFCFENDVSMTWRWECVEINNEIVKLNVTIYAIGEKTNLFISKELNVNTTSRNVFLNNGTLIGTTILWSKANPKDGEEIFVWDASPDRIVGVAQNNECYSSSPQGAQKIYNLEGKGSINGTNVFFDLFMDVDTGILVDGIIRRDATLLALGIDTIGVNGRFMFTDTNIDLGPRELLPELLQLFPIVIFIIIISVVVIIYRRRRKK